jgi:cell wall-associated NlpC family hydrolase
MIGRNRLAHLIRHFTTKCAANALILEKEFAAIMEMGKRDIFVDYAWRFIKTPYVWGGDDPMRGFDCSGFVVECLKATGHLPYVGDWTADALWKIFQHNRIHSPVVGCLVFWQSERKMVHVEIVVHVNLSLGASGGGSRTQTLQDAIEQDAYIKMRPFKDRNNKPLFYADPFKDD